MASFFKWNCDKSYVFSCIFRAIFLLVDSVFQKYQKTSTKKVLPMYDSNLRVQKL